jgi:hypothetical protein
MILACGGAGSERTTQPQQPEPTQEVVPQELKGKWRHKSYEGFGEIEKEPFHVSWEFMDGNRVKIVTPAYKALPEQAMDRSIQFFPDKRFQVYNLVGSKRVNLFSGVWSVADGELTLKFNTGDTFPKETSEPKQIEAKLVLSKSPR